MTKEKMDLYVGFLMFFVFIIIEILFYKVIKKDLLNKKLLIRNYSYAFSMGIGFVLIIIIAISLYYKTLELI